MRFACLAALGLSLVGPPVAALEIEDRLVIEGTGTATLRIISTADIEVFAPFLEAFHDANPAITLDYAAASSSDLYEAIADGATFDLAISSAMDLQFRLANDGFALPHRSDATDALPDWALWRDRIFAFAMEPAVVVIAADSLDGLPAPDTRQGLIALLRDHPDRFQGAVGTYDVRDSGLGYLFATQEARATDAYWRLSEVMGRLQPKLYCCSGQMLDDVAEGRLAVAYNVLGSYAADRIAQDSEGRVQILRMRDFSNVILRTALIPDTAEEPGLAGAFIDTLIGIGLRDEPGNWPLPPLQDISEEAGEGFGPIRLGPALMTYLDPLNRRAFLAEWTNAIEQE